MGRRLPASFLVELGSSRRVAKGCHCGTMALGVVCSVVTEVGGLGLGMLMRDAEGSNRAVKKVDREEVG